MSLEPAERATYAADLLAWSRMVEVHGLTFAEWQLERRRLKLQGAEATASELGARWNLEHAAC